MAFYLLPWSKGQTKMDLVRRDLYEVWGEGEGNRFPELNPLRSGLLKHFRVQTSPLAPVFRRYKSKFWEELSFWALPSKVQKEIAEWGLVPSPLFGLLGVSDLIPRYELGWKDTYEGKTLKNFWREHLRGFLGSLLEGEVVYDFLSSEERDVLELPENTRRVLFEYYRKGKRVVNPLPHRAYTLRYIVEMKVTPEDVERINFLDYRVKDVREEGRELRVVLHSEGRYI